MMQPNGGVYEQPKRAGTEVQGHRSPHQRRRARICPSGARRTWKLRSSVTLWKSPANGKRYARQCPPTRNCGRPIPEPGLDGLTRNAGSRDRQIPFQCERPSGRGAAARGSCSNPYYPADRDLRYIGSHVDGLPVMEGDRIRATLFGGRFADLKVESTSPIGPVLINPTTVLTIGTPRKSKQPYPTSNMGGLNHRCKGYGR